MKIKHFAGYGFVNAKMTFKGNNTLQVKVNGEHEYGLSTDDKSTVFDWLVSRFDKRRKDWIEIDRLEVASEYRETAGTYTGTEEIVTYTISFRDVA